MLATLARFMPAVRLAAVLAVTYGVFQLTLYLWLNCPNVAQARMDRANAAIVERVGIVYAANGWPGMGAKPAASAAAAAAPPDVAVAMAVPPELLDCFCGEP